MARLVLTEDEAAVCQAVGVRAFVKARSSVARDELVEVEWDAATGMGRAVVRGEPAGLVTASVVIGGDGSIKSAGGACTCDLVPDCAHAAALILLAFTSDTSRPKPAPSWELALAAFVSAESPSGGPDASVHVVNHPR